MEVAAFLVSCSHLHNVSVQVMHLSLVAIMDISSHVEMRCPDYQQVQCMHGQLLHDEVAKTPLRRLKCSEKANAFVWRHSTADQHGG